MPPKKATAVIKEKKKAIEDKTFGMKNKNKSKFVQKKIKGIATAVMGDPRKLAAEEAAKEQRKLQKLAEKEREKELKSLFNTIPSAEQQKEAEKAEAEGAEVEEKTEEEQEEEALTMLAQIEEEMKEEEEMSLEEIIDKERQKIVNGTPVTMETFKQWKEFRLKQQQKENEILRKQQEEVWKKSGSGITGRLLFEVDRSVFVDDEDADATMERVEMDESLFLDDETANLESLDINADESGEATAEASSSGEASSSSKGEEYDPATWKESQPPKSLLQEWVTRRKIKELPKYDSLPVSGTGCMCKIVLPHAGNKEFVNEKIYNNKKLAENNVALMALRYLQSQEPAEPSQ